MIKIVRLVTRLNIGGPSIHVITLSADLPAERFRTTLVCGRCGPREGSMEDLARAAGVVPRLIPSLRRPLRPVGDLMSLRRLVALLQRERPDILHTHMSKAGALGRMAARVCGDMKTVHTFHGNVLSGYFPPFANRLILQFERWCARRTDRLVVLSESQKEEMLVRYRIGSPAQYAVIPLGLDLDRFSGVQALRGELRRELAVSPDAAVVATVGRLVPIKDHSLFLDVARRVVDERPDAVFLVAGDGPLRRELETAAVKMGLSGNMRFLGWRGDLQRLYADTDVVVLTSRNEGTPVSLIEAAASGRPVVATNVGGVSDVVCDGVSGLITRRREPAEIAALVLGLLRDRKRSESMGRAGRDFVRRRYSKERLLADIERLYTELVG